MASRKIELFERAQKRALEYQEQLDIWEKERVEKEKVATRQMVKKGKVPKYMQRYYKKEEERRIEEEKTPEEIDIRKEITRQEALKKILTKEAYKRTIEKVDIAEITECGKTVNELIESIKKSKFVTDKPTKRASYEELKCLMKYIKENPKEANKIYCKLLEEDKALNK